MAGIEGDVWKQERDKSEDPKREPGPIDLNRYEINSTAGAGLASFMNWPVALNQEDLDAGDVDVAVIGAPLDLATGSGAPHSVLGRCAPPTDTSQVGH